MEDISTTIEELKQKAESGDTHAMMVLAKHYNKENNEDLTLYYLQMAVDAEDADAMYAMGIAKIYSVNYEEEGVELLKKLADADNDEAQLQLGNYYREKGVLEEARKYYLMAAEHNYLNAKIHLLEMSPLAAEPFVIHNLQRLHNNPEDQMLSYNLSLYYDVHYGTPSRKAYAKSYIKDHGLPALEQPAMAEAEESTEIGLTVQEEAQPQVTNKEQHQYSDYDMPLDNTGWFEGVDSFEGRWRRREFVPVFVSSIFLAFAGSLIPNLGYLSFFALLLIIPAAVKRLHDFNVTSKWLLAIPIIAFLSIVLAEDMPVISTILGIVVVLFFLALFFYPGDKGINSYGSNPRFDYDSQLMEIENLRVSDNINTPAEDNTVSASGGKEYSIVDGAMTSTVEIGGETIELIPVHIGDKYGFINADNEEIIPLEYEDVICFREGLAPVKHGGKWGYIDPSGKVIIDFKFDGALLFVEGRALVRLNDKFGFIDKDGRVRVPIVYDYADTFSNGLAPVMADDISYNFVDYDGNGYIQTPSAIVPVIPVYYEDNEDDDSRHENDEEYDHAEGLQPFNKDGKYGFINHEGNIVIPIMYDCAFDFSEGLACVSLDEKNGFINKKGQIVVPLIYDDALPFHKGLAAVSLDGKYGFIDHDGNIVVPLMYDCVADFSEGRAFVRLDGKCGYIDTKRQTVIPLVYEKAHSFHEGLAVVSLNGKYGFINYDGSVVIPMMYDFATDFVEGSATVYRDDVELQIDKQGNEYPYEEE